MTKIYEGLLSRNLLQRSPGLDRSSPPPLLPLDSQKMKQKSVFLRDSQNCCDSQAVSTKAEICPIFYLVTKRLCLAAGRRKGPSSAATTDLKKACEEQELSGPRALHGRRGYCGQFTVRPAEAATAA